MTFPQVDQLRKIDAARAMEILSRLTGHEWTHGMGVYFCGRPGMMCATASDPVPAIREALLKSGRHSRVIVEYVAAHSRQPASVRVNTTQWHTGPDEETAYVRALLADYEHEQPRSGGDQHGT